MKVSENFNWIWSILGSLGTAVAIISIIQRLGDIELATLPFKYLGYYRSLMSTLTEWVPLPFGWSIVQWYADLMSISAILMVTINRSEKIAPLNPDPSLTAYKENQSPILRTIADLAGFLFFLFLAPLGIILSLLIILRTYIYWKEEGGEINIGRRVQFMDAAAEYWFKTFSLLLIIVSTATFLFFLINGLKLNG